VSPVLSVRRKKTALVEDSFSLARSTAAFHEVEFPIIALIIVAQNCRRESSHSIQED
jgi:hypothetical protein